MYKRLTKMSIGGHMSRVSPRSTLPVGNLDPQLYNDSLTFQNFATAETYYSQTVPLAGCAHAQMHWLGGDETRRWTSAEDGVRATGYWLVPLTGTVFELGACDRQTDGQQQLRSMPHGLGGGP